MENMPRLVVFAILFIALIFLIASILMPLAVLRISANVIKIRKEIKENNDFIASQFARINKEIEKGNQMLDEFLSSIQID